MSVMNVARIGASVLFSRFSGRKTPVNVMWRLTDRCNYRCSYCNISSRGKKEISTAQAFSLIDQMYDLGTRRIGIVGGEAFMREDFLQIVKEMKKKGIYVTLVTNGSLVHKNIVVIRMVDCVIVSLDGKKESHDWNRMPGSHDAVMRSLKSLYDNEINVMTNTVLSKHNLKDIPFVLDTAKRFGFRSTFNLIQGRSNDYPSGKEYRKALSIILELKRKGFPVVLSETTIDFLRSWKDHKKFVSEKEIPGYRCFAGELIFNIDTDGTIAPCDILSNVWKDNPDCISLGLKEAIDRIPERRCKACTCSHVIEYNHLFSFHPKTIASWLPIVIKGNRI